MIDIYELPTADRIARANIGNGAQLILNDNRPAWHALGTVQFERGLTVSAGVKRIGADFDIIKARSQYIVNGQQVDGTDYGFFRTKGTEIIQLTTAKNGFVPIPNTEFAKILDPLVQFFPIATIGMLGDGAVLWVLFDIGERRIRREDFQKYMLVANPMQKGQAVKAVVTNVRVVCSNTLAMAMAAAQVQIWVRHAAGGDAMLGAYVQLQKQFLAAQDATARAFEAMMTARMAKEQVAQYLKTVYADPPLPSTSKMKALTDDTVDLGAIVGGRVHSAQRDYDSEKKLMVERREAALTAYDVMATAEPGLDTGSVFHAWNAVTFEESHRPERGTLTETNQQRLAASILDGARARTMRDAFSTALQFLEKGELVPVRR